MIDPLWRHALGAWRRDLPAALALIAATVLLVVAVTTGPLVVAASGQAALETAFDSAPTVATVGAPSVVVAPASDGRIADALRSRLTDLPGFADPVQRLTSLRYRISQGGDAVRPVVRRGTMAATAVLFHQSGAVEGLEVIAGPDPGGDVWVPDHVAERLGLGPGDELEVGLDPVGQAASRTAATTRVAGVYATCAGWAPCTAKPSTWERAWSTAASSSSMSRP